MNVAHPAARRVSAMGEVRFAPSRALQRVYDATCGLYDRALYPRRHQAVRRRLSNGQGPRRILVVCHGNLCRSPYLQAVLQRSLPDVTVTSAGFAGSDRAVPQVSVALCAQRGLDLSRYRSRPITQSKVSEADLLIVMDAYQARRLARMFRVKRERIVIAGDLEPMFEASRAIRDPWNHSIEAFRATFDRLDRCAASLVKILRPTYA
jgi:protein-tyrosine phosphatase